MSKAASTAVFMVLFGLPALGAGLGVFVSSWFFLLIVPYAVLMLIVALSQDAQRKVELS